jgi:hypothetical protein
MSKNNSRDSSKFKGFIPLQLSCNLTGNSNNTLNEVIAKLSTMFDI